MQVTNRDIDIFTTLNEVGYMSSKQIESTFFVSYRTCMRRLYKLEVNDYVKASPLLYNREKVYWLGKNGMKFVYTLDKNVHTRKASALIPHYLSCGEFYLAIRNKFNIEVFDTEFDVDFEYEGKKINFRPDIHLGIEGFGDYLVEVDNAKKKYLMKQKIKNYEAFARSKEYKKYFDIYPSVIVISDATEGFKVAIEEVKTLPISYYLTEFSNLENIEKVVWLKTGKKERCRLWS